MATTNTNDSPQTVSTDRMALVASSPLRKIVEPDNGTNKQSVPTSRSIMNVEDFLSVNVYVMKQIVRSIRQAPKVRTVVRWYESSKERDTPETTRINISNLYCPLLANTKTKEKEKTIFIWKINSLSSVRVLCNQYSKLNKGIQKTRERCINGISMTNGIYINTMWHSQHNYFDNQLATAIV